jgi:hypothetical protein
MSTKFSSGPWNAELSEAYNVRAGHGGIVAQIHHLKGRYGMGGRVPADEAAANAALIADAPKMYDIIRRLTDTKNTQNLSELYKEARALLARHEGEKRS